MRQISGTYSFYLHTFRSPSEFSVNLAINSFLNITLRGHFFEFALKSDTKRNDDFEFWISTFADGLGFLLDIPIYSSYSTAVEEVPSPSQTNLSDSRIDFDFVKHTMKYDQSVGHYVDTEIPKQMSFLRSEIERFISKLGSDELLVGTVVHYLKALEEPEFFLGSLYKAYELMKDTGAISKTAAKKLTHLANDPGIYGSRHASGKTSSFRSMTPEERLYCQELIRNGILQLVRNS